nr:hypothetical protein [Tanacetum cinerariifolium]
AAAHQQRAFALAGRAGGAVPPGSRAAGGPAARAPFAAALSGGAAASGAAARRGAAAVEQRGPGSHRDLFRSPRRAGRDAGNPRQLGKFECVSLHPAFQAGHWAAALPVCAALEN